MKAALLGVAAALAGLGSYHARGTGTAPWCGCTGGEREEEGVGTKGARLTVVWLVAWAWRGQQAAVGG